MDYESMWKSMKSTYENRLIKLESEGKKDSNAWINAKRIVDVMTGFELNEKGKLGRIADISINDIRAMAEHL